MQEMHPDLQPAVERIRLGKLVLADQIKAAVIESWSTPATEAALEEPLSPDKQNALARLYKDLGITPQEMKKSEGFRVTAFS